MAKYKSKPRVIDAEQYNGPRKVDWDGIPPTVRGVHWHRNAFDNCQWPHVVTIQEQIVRIEPGEWIVDEGDGQHFYPISAEKFAEKYQPLTEPKFQCSTPGPNTVLPPSTMIWDLICAHLAGEMSMGFLRGILCPILGWDGNQADAAVFDAVERGSKIAELFVTNPASAAASVLTQAYHAEGTTPGSPESSPLLPTESESPSMGQTDVSGD